MSKRILPLLLCGILYATLLYGGHSPLFSRLSLENGLPGMSVRCLYEDKFGYLWMGIDSKGLCRYDGTRFVTFSCRNSDSTTISNNFVTSICEDPSGNIWVGTESGLNLYNRKSGTFSRFISHKNNPKSLVDNKINFVKTDSQGILWIGTDKGLNSIDLRLSVTNGFKRHIFPHSLHLSANPADITVNSLFEDTDGSRWIGTKNGLFRYNKDLSELMFWEAGNYSGNGLTCNKIFSIIQLQNNIYLGTNDGIFRFRHTQSDKIEFEHLHVVPHTTNINDLAVMDDHLWIATAFEGLYLYPISELTISRTSSKSAFKVHGIDSNLIKDLIITSDSTIWVATELQGLYLSNKHATLFSYELEKEEITAFLKDNKGREWIGTKTKGVYERNPVTRSLKQVLAKDECNQVNTIAQVGNELYIGCFSGLIRYHIDKGTFVRFSFSKIQCIVPWKNELLIGSKNGVYLFQPGKGTFLALPVNNFIDAQKLSTIITALVQTSDKIWIGTDSKGLMAYDPTKKTVTHYEEQHYSNDGLLSNYIRSVYKDRKGNIWIGSKYKGLSCFDPLTQKFSHYNEEDGLANPSVYAITEDLSGYLYAGTHEAISRFDPVRHTFENYGRMNGLKTNCIIEPNAAYSAPDGNLFFGSMNGLIQFYPESIEEKEEGKFIFSSLMVNGEYKLSSLVHDTLIELAHTENFLVFDFAYINYLKSSSISYFYQLEGVNENWVQLGRLNTVSFSQLRPGNFNFKFGIRDSQGHIKEAPFTIRIKIRHFFLTSPAAYLLYAILCLFILVLAWKYYQTKQKMEEIKRQMKKFQEKTASAGIFTHSVALPLQGILQETIGKTEVSVWDENELFLKRCYEILEENYSKENFNVNSFSQQIGMSRTNFYTKLKSISGFTPSNMIWEYRLLKAAHLLKILPNAVSDIAFQCGFENMSSFSTMFKKKFGKTPSEYKDIL